MNICCTFEKKFKTHVINRYNYQNYLEKLSAYIVIIFVRCTIRNVLLFPGSYSFKYI